MAGGYGLEIADIDGDGLLDIVALATNPAQFVWYRNPSWDKHLITANSRGDIAAAAQDIDGDGDIDLVLASEFSLAESTQGGLLQWFENPGNPTQNQEWQAYTIDRVPTSHRLRWGNFNGKGPSLINLPIIGIGASAPRYEGGAQMKAYEIPANPKGPWGSVEISDDLEMAHGIAVVDWNADGRDDLLTASFAGINLSQFAIDGRFVKQTPIGVGNRGERPTQGSSEVGLGSLPDGSRFIASIEPWHGNEVVVYRPNEDGTRPWQREIIDDTFEGGHALIVADLDNDGVDEIVAGHRSSPYGLYSYYYMAATSQWERTELDAGGIGVAGIAVVDLNGDGYRDIVAIGSATGNVVLFESRVR
tara:strand:+ start:3693 stop:4775 length:1083 start_codon:yes stop_codon:yes gene_type:complete